MRHQIGRNLAQIIHHRIKGAPVPVHIRNNCNPHLFIRLREGGYTR